MKFKPRKRYWLECASALCSGTLFLLTLLWPDWIEAIFGIEPDSRGGWLEMALAVSSLAATLIAASLARIERIRTLTAAG